MLRLYVFFIRSNLANKQPINEQNHFLTIKMEFKIKKIKWYKVSFCQALLS